MPTHTKSQETTFYSKLQSCSDLDLRDIRGKRHALSFILLGLVLALLRGRDGNLSSIHRSMVNQHDWLCAQLGLRIPRAVSRAQLPRILSKVCLSRFETILFNHYGLRLGEAEKQWFSVDGKELRGSIEPSSTRGNVLVQLVRHQDRSVLGQAFYDGRKESERPCAYQLLHREQGQGQKITADALHLYPVLTESIQQAGGIFLIGLKGNQAELQADMLGYVKRSKPVQEEIHIELGHGRVEQRKYRLYSVKQEYFDERWTGTGFQSLIQVQRQREIIKTQKKSQETSYYLSNGPTELGEEYFQAIRNHWGIEVNHHIRDVTLKEDAFRTQERTLSRIMATLRTLILEIIRKEDTKNIAALFDLFQDDRQILWKFLKKIEFL